ncbi:hypothetical protein ACK2SD_05045 [Pseudomonas sp. SC11]|uniref:hypothetical protein n=1 Tax=Pseudomonas sp. SC11 TaxID=326927 RepID=UPI003999FEA6
MTILTFPIFTFIKRFYPVAVLGLLLTLTASVIATDAVAAFFFKSDPNYHLYSIGMLAAGAFTVGPAQYAVMRGTSEATWVIVVLLVFNLLASALMYLKPGMEIFSVIGMLSSCAALACFNSRRYRQLCKRVKVIRRMRERFIAQCRSEP